MSPLPGEGVKPLYLNYIRCLSQAPTSLRALKFQPYTAPTWLIPTAIPLGGHMWGHDAVWALPNPFLFHQGAGRVLMQVQVTPVPPCSSFWVGFSSLG